MDVKQPTINHFIGGGNQRRPQPCHTLVTVFWIFICKHVLSRGSKHISVLQFIHLFRIKSTTSVV